MDSSVSAYIVPMLLHGVVVYNTVGTNMCLIVLNMHGGGGFYVKFIHFASLVMKPVLIMPYPIYEAKFRLNVFSYFYSILLLPETLH